MAGDWIKMRMGLRTHPKVMRLSSAMGSDRLRVVGGLHAVWCVFDEHSEAGILEGYSLEAMDQTIGWPGFSEALTSVGWLITNEHGLVMPDFAEHNGKSAKRRCEDQRRKRDERMRPQSVRNLSANDSDKTRTREEKKIEENDEPQRASPPACPHDEIIKLYHSNCPSMPRVKAWTEKREKMLKARWREEPERQNLDWWANFFKYCDRSTFLRGDTSSGFTASLEWIITTGNFVKIIEGQYENREVQ